jgi:acyl transferase domain-containing protein
MLLPDVREHMDASQYLASLAAEKVLAGLPETWTQLKTEIGVVLGLSSKTERGIRANERIFLDRFRRRISEQNGEDESLSNAQAARLVEILCSEIETSIIPSGPYTRPCLMPNVAASRISSLFDLKGPNLIIDCGRDSLFQTILTAERLLAHDNCRMVLAGGLNGTGGPDGLWAETALILGLTTIETARQAGFPVLGLLTVTIGEDAAGDRSVELKPLDGFDYRV